MIENGHNAASMAVIEAVSCALNVSAAWLAFGVGPRDPVPLHFRRKAGQFAVRLDALPEAWCKEAATMLRAAYGLAVEDNDE